jgi:hypothetical protein
LSQKNSAKKPLSPSARALKAVEDRQGTRGHPGPIAAATALLWSAYLAVDIAVEDVAMLNLLQKVAREKYGNADPDNLTDIAGWADVYEMVKEWAVDEFDRVAATD